MRLDLAESARYTHPRRRTTRSWIPSVQTCAPPANRGYGPDQRRISPDRRTYRLMISIGKLGVG
jgi:hypothetical protein